MQETEELEVGKIQSTLYFIINYSQTKHVSIYSYKIKDFVFYLIIGSVWGYS